MATVTVNVTLPGQVTALPLEWDGKVAKIYSKPYYPSVIDIHREEEPKPEPKIQVFDAYPPYINQLWIFKHAGQGLWSLQNVGTGRFLGTTAARALQAKKDIEEWVPMLSVDEHGRYLILQQGPSAATGAFAALAGSGPGRVIDYHGIEKAIEGEGLLWRLEEWQLSKAELQLAVDARMKAEAARKAAREAAAAEAARKVAEEAKAAAEAEAAKRAAAAAKAAAEAEAARKAAEAAAAKRAAEAEAARKVAEAEAARKAAEAKAAADAEAARQAAEAAKASPAAAAAAAAKSTPVGGKVSDTATVAALNKIGGCPNGYSWKRTDGGFICSGGGHRVHDAQLNHHHHHH